MIYIGQARCGVLDVGIPKNWYHPSPQQRYLEAQKPKKRAKVLLFFGLTKCFVDFFVKKDFLRWCVRVFFCVWKLVLEKSGMWVELW